MQPLRRLLIDETVASDASGAPAAPQQPDAAAGGLGFVQSSQRIAFSTSRSSTYTPFAISGSGAM
jgi:hypothetical protein